MSKLPSLRTPDGPVKTLSEWREFARRDDCLARMVPSDLRCILSSVKEKDAEIERLRADLAKPRVRKLEWFECHGNIGVEMAHPPCGRGDSFMVGKSLEADGLFCLWVGRDHAGDYPSRDDAKAAAQADYESDILSALEDDDG